MSAGALLSYPNVFAIPEAAAVQLQLRVSNGGTSTGTVNVHAGGAEGDAEAAIVARCTVAPTGGWDQYALVRCATSDNATASFGPATNITLTFAGAVEEFAHLDSLAFVL